jgi:16S rRNA (cytidine1402-2'-O)-methyltransferase
VENVRTARRWLKRFDKEIDINAITFYELNVHTDPAVVSSYLEPLKGGEPMGVMSEAGCPAVADPGSLAVAQAQRWGLKVIPLIGPSSILTSLMASGFNGQSFTFHGYLPIEEGPRLRKLREMEADTEKHATTHIFIETPYRNNRMVKYLSETLRPSTMLCVAAAITDPERECIITSPASAWRKAHYDYAKLPAIFLIGRTDTAVRK